MSATTTYTISGMTCGHCVASVEEEIGELAGVEQVSVDLASATATVVGDVAAEDVAAAVVTAGYQLVS